MSANTTFEMAVESIDLAKAENAYFGKLAQVAWAAVRELGLRFKLDEELQYPVWADASDWQKKLAIYTARFWLENKEKNPPDSIIHDKWVNHQIHSGWRYGVVSDPDEKKDNRLMPFTFLSDKHVLMTRLFRVVVESCHTLGGYHSFYD